MDHLLKEVELNGKLYRVYDDYDGYSRVDDQDFESEEQRREYLHKFETGEMHVYRVEAWSLCEHCSNPHDLLDSLCGIGAESEDQALEYFTTSMEVVA